MASGRSTNTVEEILQNVLGDISKAKASVDGMQWLQQLVTVETTILKAIEEGRNQQMQQQMQASQQQPGMQGQQMGGPPAMGGAPMGAPPAGLGPSPMGPAGMPGAPGPGIPGLRRSSPGAPDELRRILDAGPG